MDIYPRHGTMTASVTIAMGSGDHLETSRDAPELFELVEAVFGPMTLGLDVLVQRAARPAIKGAG